MNAPSPHKQLDAWVIGYLDGVLGPADFARLSQAMHDDPAALDRFVELATLDRSLLDTLRHSDEVQAIHHAKLEQADPALSFEATLALLGRGSESAELVHVHTLGSANPLQRAMPYLVGGAIAAVLTLAVTLTFVFSGGSNRQTQSPGFSTNPNEPGPSEPGRVVATLTAEHDAYWAEGAFAPGSDLKPGQTLTLTTGFAEITTEEGAVVILEAPATVELLNHNNAIRLHTGKLVGICETELSQGFVVKTDYADITDLGTEFGVNVSRNQVTTSVFTGEVEIAIPGSKPQSLSANQTARLTVRENQPQLLIVNHLSQERFVRQIPAADAVVSARVLNVTGFEVQVVAQGVYEDALIYSDREHELNGIDEGGLPLILRSGDLIRMPSDVRPNVLQKVLKSNQDASSLQLELTLNKLSDIYLLSWDRETDQPWLLKDYTPTELLVGLDLVGREAGYDIGVGPGESVERRLRVWKRNQPAVGTIIAAGNVLGDTMYSVIVVPR